MATRLMILIVGVLVAVVSVNLSAQDRGFLAIGAESARYAFSFRGEADAINMCGTTDCEVVAAFDACIGVAYSRPTLERGGNLRIVGQGPSVWSWAEAAEEGAARVAAFENCQSAGGTACEVYADCVDVPAGTSDLRTTTTTQPPPISEISERLRTRLRRLAATLNREITGSVQPRVVEDEAITEQAQPPANDPPAAATASRPAGGVGSPTETSAGGASFGGAADVDPPRRPGEVFRDCAECPEMVVLAGGVLAMGRYEVTAGEYRAFAATGGTGRDEWRGDDYWWYAPTDRHPITYVSWDDAQAYVSWLNRRTGATYRLPSEAEWERAAVGSQPGCDPSRGPGGGTTCPVGSFGANAAGLSDMVGNLQEWTSDCGDDGECDIHVLRGGSWYGYGNDVGPGTRNAGYTASRFHFNGFRVARTLD